MITSVYFHRSQNQSKFPSGVIYGEITVYPQTLKGEMMEQHSRPGWSEYYMGIAMSVRERADCLGNRVGAILVLHERINSTGYNRTPARMKNCTDGWC